MLYLHQARISEKPRGGAPLKIFKLSPKTVNNFKFSDIFLWLALQKILQPSQIDFPVTALISTKLSQNVCLINTHIYWYDDIPDVTTSYGGFSGLIGSLDILILDKLFFIKLS